MRFLLIIITIATFTSCGTISSRASGLAVKCIVDGDNYTVRVRNSSTKSLWYWVVPVGGPDLTFRRIPFGATLLLRSEGGKVSEGSTMRRISDTIGTPVTMVRIRPGVEVEYVFKLSDLCMFDGGLVALRKSYIEFKVRVAVFISDDLQDSVIGESDWCDLGAPTDQM